MRMKRKIGIAIRSDMIELLDRNRAIRLDRICDLAEMRDHAVIGMSEVAPRQDCGRMHGHGFHHDHCRATDSPLSVVGDMPVAWNAIDGHIRSVRAEDDTVAQYVRA